MPDPVLHLLAGPNGAGKSTLFSEVIEPTTHLEFVNADVIAADRWPNDPSARSYDAARLAAARRAELIDRRSSFATETVFSHESKVDLVTTALAAGYLITLHVVMVPVSLAIARVKTRVVQGGHAVPESKVRDRYKRLWPLVAKVVDVVDHAQFYDNTRTAQPFRVVATFEHGVLVGTPDWPAWTPKPLRRL
jgi:predicted ABC-type ATPase